MSGEAYRWTAKTPSELYHTLGPHGVDHLVRQMLDACWRRLPDEARSVAVAKRAAQEVYDRNMAVWAKIKQPSPEAFFRDLLPIDTEQYMRQAMVTCWMMMPRTGGRKVSDVRRIVGEIFQRNIDAWNADEATFTGKNTKSSGAAKKAKPAKPAKGKAKAKTPIKTRRSAQARSR
jgi:hypothetical protein